jgi:hypothetical protein
MDWGLGKRLRFRCSIEPRESRDVGLFVLFALCRPGNGAAWSVDIESPISLRSNVIDDDLRRQAN